MLWQFCFICSMMGSSQASSSQFLLNNLQYVSMVKTEPFLASQKSILLLPLENAKQAVSAIHLVLEGIRYNANPYCFPARSLLKGFLMPFIIIYDWLIQLTMISHQPAGPFHFYSINISACLLLPESSTEIYISRNGAFHWSRAKQLNVKVMSSTATKNKRDNQDLKEQC